MKYWPSFSHLGEQVVAPARERGLKSWIVQRVENYMLVAPARERGLKLMYLLMLSKVGSRSREGAWIEILFGGKPFSINNRSLPRGSVD